MTQIVNLAANRPDNLTELQARLAEGMVLDGLSKQDAITAAGYASLSAGYTALRTQHVQEYIQQLIREHLQGSAIKAIRRIDDLIDHARSEYVRLEAAKDVLDRAGFKPVEKHAHMVQGNVTVTIDLG